MKTLARLHLRFLRSRLHLPAAFLIALLQRTPVVRVLAVSDELVASSPLGAILKSAVAAVASLGAIHSLAGATVLQSSQNSPVSTKVGSSSTQVAFTVTNTINIMSWSIGGTLPPGMSLMASEDSSVAVSGPGILDATGGGVSDGYGGYIGGVSTTTPVLRGTPTTPGTYTFTLQAFEFGGLSGLASNAFSFTVNVAADVTVPTTVAPSFAAQPQSVGVITGGSITLTAAASGTPTPTYQWNKNGAPINGATNASLVIPAAQASDAASYTVTITNSVSSVTSAAAVVTVAPPATQGTAPAFVQSPLSQTVIGGATVAFNVTATGSPAPTFQWLKDGVAIANATKSSLILTGVTAANAGSYTVVASNGVANTTSAGGTLALAAATNFGHLTNLAIFATLTSAVPDFTVATVIGGGSGGTKPLLVRAVGPSLTQLGVGGVVSDTKVDLFAGSTLASSNDNWNGDVTLSNTFTAVGAFGYASAASKDSAIFLPTAQPGSYSVKVSGVGGATGVVLAELYDAQPSGSFTAASNRFLDVSVLKQIAGDESLTVGFNIAGSTSRTVLIRAVGPALGALGVGGVMPDPQLDLYSGATILTSNDNWGGDPQVNAAFTSVGAFGFSNATSKDAVVIATLAPGNYTAVVKGVNGSSGLALVEVYDVP